MLVTLGLEILQKVVYLQLCGEGGVHKETERIDKEGDGAEQIAIPVYSDGFDKHQQPVSTTPLTGRVKGIKLKKTIYMIIYSYHSEAMVFSMFLYF